MEKTKVGDSSCGQYAFGIIIWELFTRLEPYQGEVINDEFTLLLYQNGFWLWCLDVHFFYQDLKEVISQVADLNLTPPRRPVITSDIPPAVKELLGLCWSRFEMLSFLFFNFDLNSVFYCRIPDHRPSFEEISERISLQQLELTSHKEWNQNIASQVQDVFSESTSECVPSIVWALLSCIIGCTRRLSSTYCQSFTGG